MYNYKKNMPYKIVQPDSVICLSRQMMHDSIHSGSSRSFP